MIDRVKEQAYILLDSILDKARSMKQTQNEDERKTLLEGIEQDCFQARTLIKDLSFVYSNECNGETKGVEVASKAQMSDAPTRSNGKKYVLIAEDVDCNYLLASLVLKKNYRVERARNGREAVEMVARERPDIVLMDIKMPVMDGYEACEKLKAMDPTLPVIAVTAYTQMEEEANIMKRGFDGFLPKPINLGAFTRLVADKLAV